MSAVTGAVPGASAGPVDLHEAVQVHPAYRPDIDGLRAVAVLSVIGFHAFSWWIPGGFVGVDVFFVISGYLITTIILGNLRRGDFSTVTFYARRIKRIFPALIVVVAAVWVTGWLRLFPDEYRQLGKHMAAGAGFASNFVLRTDSGYFDSVAETKPLLHLWSLAIEEQFYILWPLVLAFATRRRSAGRAIAAIAVVSFAYGLLILDREPDQAFYSPLARFWELMIGGLLAHAMLARPRWFDRFHEVRSLSGLGLVVVSVAMFVRGVPFPGWRALLPTAGAFLLISAGPTATFNRLVLSNRLAVWFGRISYPLYLWHWPLLSFVYIAEGDGAARGLRLGAVGLGIVLAWLTYAFVEMPIRRSRDASWLPLGLVGGLLAVGVVGYATFAFDGFASRKGAAGEFSASFDNALPDMRYSTRHGVFAAFREECNFYDMDRWRAGRSTNLPRGAIDPSCTARPPATTRAVFVWGDSHAQHLNSGLRAALPDDVALLQVATSSCPAGLVGPDEPDGSSCRASNRYALEVIRKDPPDVVLIAQREGHSITHFREVAEALRKAGVRHVVVVGPIPQWNPNLNKVIASRYWDTRPVRLAAHLDPGTVRLERNLKAARRPDEPFTYIDLFDGLCDDRGCLTTIGSNRPDDLITFDYGHLSPAASAFVCRTMIVPTLMRLLDADRVRPGPRV